MAVAFQGEDHEGPIGPLMVRAFSTCQRTQRVRPRPRAAAAAVAAMAAVGGGAKCARGAGGGQTTPRRRRRKMLAGCRRPHLSPSRSAAPSVAGSSGRLPAHQTRAGVGGGRRWPAFPERRQRRSVRLGQQALQEERRRGPFRGRQQVAAADASPREGLRFLARPSALLLPPPCRSRCSRPSA